MTTPSIAQEMKGGEEVDEKEEMGAEEGAEIATEEPYKEDVVEEEKEGEGEKAADEIEETAVAEPTRKRKRLHKLRRELDEDDLDLIISRRTVERQEAIVEDESDEDSSVHSADHSPITSPAGGDNDNFDDLEDFIVDDDLERAVDRDIESSSPSRKRIRPDATKEQHGPAILTRASYGQLELAREIFGELPDDEVGEIEEDEWRDEEPDQLAEEVDEGEDIEEEEKAEKAEMEVDVPEVDEKGTDVAPVVEPKKVDIAALIAREETISLEQRFPKRKELPDMPERFFGHAHLMRGMEFPDAISPDKLLDEARWIFETEPQFKEIKVENVPEGATSAVVIVKQIQRVLLFILKHRVEVPYIAVYQKDVLAALAAVGKGELGLEGTQEQDHAFEMLLWLIFDKDKEWYDLQVQRQRLRVKMERVRDGFAMDNDETRLLSLDQFSEMIDGHFRLLEAAESMETIDDLRTYYDGEGYGIPQKFHVKSLQKKLSVIETLRLSGFGAPAQTLGLSANEFGLNLAEVTESLPHNPEQEPDELMEAFLSSRDLTSRYSTMRGLSAIRRLLAFELHMDPRVRQYLRSFYRTRPSQDLMDEWSGAERGGSCNLIVVPSSAYEKQDVAFWRMVDEDDILKAYVHWKQGIPVWKVLLTENLVRKARIAESEMEALLLVAEVYRMEFLRLTALENEGRLRITLSLSDVIDSLRATFSSKYCSDAEVNEMAQVWNEERKLVIHEALETFITPFMEESIRREIRSASLKDITRSACSATRAFMNVQPIDPFFQERRDLSSIRVRLEERLREVLMSRLEHLEGLKDQKQREISGGMLAEEELEKMQQESMKCVRLIALVQYRLSQIGQALGRLMGEIQYGDEDEMNAIYASYFAEMEPSEADGMTGDQRLMYRLDRFRTERMEEESLWMDEEFSSTKDYVVGRIRALRQVLEKNKGLPETRVLAVACGDEGGSRQREPHMCALLSDAGELVDYCSLPWILDTSGPSNDGSSIRAERVKENYSLLRAFFLKHKPSILVGGVNRTKSLKLIDIVVDVCGQLQREGALPYLHNLPLPVLRCAEDHARVFGESRRAKRLIPSPDSSVLRRAVGLGRRALDPLNEMAAMVSTGEVLALGLHPELRKVNRSVLLKSLEREVVILANRVGINVNEELRLSHRALLRFVCGLGPRSAETLRQKLLRSGELVTSRRMLLQEELMSEAIFMCASGFLRVSREHKFGRREGPRPSALDGTRIHPKNYDLARQVAAGAMNEEVQPPPGRKKRDEDPTVGLIKLANTTIRRDPMKRTMDHPGLESIDIDAFADMLLQSEPDKPRLYTLRLIKSEFVRPFGDPRMPLVEKSPDEIFSFVTGIPVGAMKIGEPVEADVIGVARKQIDMGGPVEVVGLRCLLNIANRLPAFLPLSNIESDEIPRLRQSPELFDQLIGKPLPCFIRDIDPLALKVILSYRAMEPLPVIDEDQFDENGNKIEGQRYVFRPIDHPSYHNVAGAKAAVALIKESLDPNKIVFRPSYKGLSTLSMTWRFIGDIFLHVDIMERGKIETNPSALGQELWIGDLVFEDLDSVCEKYVHPVQSRVAELVQDAHFQNKPKEEVCAFLEQEKQANKRSLPWAICPNPDIPGHCVFAYLPVTRVRKEDLVVSYLGFIYRGRKLPTFWDFMKYFKEHWKEAPPPPRPVPTKELELDPWL